jgi:uncharacterized protein (UPF0333 family)
MNKRGLLGLIILVVVVVAIVVGGYFLFSHGSKIGILTLQITDAPADLNISKALVTISKVEVHLAPGSINESENVSTGWFTVVEGPVQYDLVAIKDTREFLGSKNLTAGKYTQVRLSVDKAIVTINGTEYDLSIPSNKIKLIQGFDIKADETTTLTLDFNAAESINARGNGGGYVMNPTIKIIQE